MSVVSRKALQILKGIRFQYIQEYEKIEMEAMATKTHVFWNKKFLTSSMKVPLGKEFSNWRTQYKPLQTTAIPGQKKPVELPTCLQIMIRITGGFRLLKI